MIEAHAADPFLWAMDTNAFCTSVRKVWIRGDSPVALMYWAFGVNCKEVRYAVQASLAGSPSDNDPMSAHRALTSLDSQVETLDDADLDVVGRVFNGCIFQAMGLISKTGFLTPVMSDLSKTRSAEYAAILTRCHAGVVFDCVGSFGAT